MRRLFLFVLMSGLVVLGCDRSHSRLEDDPHLADLESMIRTVRWQEEQREVKVATVAVGFIYERGWDLLYGRGFAAADEDRGAVVLSYELWQRMMAGRVEVVGAELILDDEATTIVGVLPQDVGGDIDLFTPNG